MAASPVAPGGIWVDCGPSAALLREIAHTIWTVQVRS